MILQGDTIDRAAPVRKSRSGGAGIAHDRRRVFHSNLGLKHRALQQGSVSAHHDNTREVSVRLSRRFCKHHVTRRGVTRLLQCGVVSGSAVADDGDAARSAQPGD